MTKVIALDAESIGRSTRNVYPVANARTKGAARTDRNEAIAIERIVDD
jgi:hypothetical protein